MREDKGVRLRGRRTPFLVFSRVRACEEMVRVSAISYANRGTERRVNTPFGVDSEVCIGCGACTYICPTGCIEMVGEPYAPGGRRLKMGDLALEPCPNDYQCVTCELEKQFVEEMKGAVKDFRQQG